MKYHLKELYEVKRTLKELGDKKGRGTELVTVDIPPDKQDSDVVKHMREELSQSANIKSKQTKKNVQSAIEVIMQRMKLFPKPPEKGLVLFVGMIPKGGRVQRKWKPTSLNHLNLFKLTYTTATPLSF